MVSFCLYHLVCCGQLMTRDWSSSTGLNRTMICSSVPLKTEVRVVYWSKVPKQYQDQFVVGSNPIFVSIMALPLLAQYMSSGFPSRGNASLIIAPLKRARIRSSAVIIPDSTRLLSLVSSPYLCAFFSQ